MTLNVKVLDKDRKTRALIRKAVEMSGGEIFRRSRGIFFSYPSRERIEEIVANIPHQQVDIIVVTDGERAGAGGIIELEHVGPHVKAGR